VSKQQDREN